MRYFYKCILKWGTVTSQKEFLRFSCKIWYLSKGSRFNNICTMFHSIQKLMNPVTRQFGHLVVRKHWQQRTFKVWTLVDNSACVLMPWLQLCWPAQLCCHRKCKKLFLLWFHNMLDIQLKWDLYRAMYILSKLWLVGSVCLPKTWPSFGPVQFLCRF